MTVCWTINKQRVSHPNPIRLSLSDGWARTVPRRHTVGAAFCSVPLKKSTQEKQLVKFSPWLRRLLADGCNFHHYRLLRNLRLRDENNGLHIDKKNGQAIPPLCLAASVHCPFLCRPYIPGVIGWVCVNLTGITKHIISLGLVVNGKSLWCRVDSALLQDNCPSKLSRPPFPSDQTAVILW